MTEVQELEQQVDGVEEGVEEESRQPEPTAEADADSRQPEKPKVNLDDSPEFREWKSQYDKRLAQMEQQRKQEIAYYQQQLEQRETAELDDYGKLEYQLRKEQQEKQSLAARLQEMEVQQARQEALHDISTAMDVPMEVIAEAQDYRDAVRLAADYKQFTEQQRAAKAQAEADAKAKAKAERAAANRPDTGGPAAPTGPNPFKDAKTSRDLAKLFWSSSGQ